MPKKTLNVVELYRNDPRTRHITHSRGTQEEADNMGVLIFSRSGQTPLEEDTPDKPKDNLPPEEKNP